MQFRYLLLAVFLFPLISVAQSLIPFKADDGKYGYHTTSGRIAIPARYEKAYSFDNGFAEVVVGGKSGFIDKTGKMVMQSKYDRVSVFADGFAYVILDNKYGFINTSFREVIPPVYEDASYFSEGLAPVKSGGKYGFIDPSGKVVIPFQFERAYSFSEGLAIISQDNNEGYIDKSGNVVLRLPAGGDRPGSFSNGLAYFRYVGGKYGYMNKAGNVVIEARYDDAFSFSDGWGHVVRDNKHYFLDTSGSVVLKLPFEHVYYFSDGLCEVESSGKHGYIDKTGKIIIPLQFDNASSFNGGTAHVWKDDAEYTIDKQGNIIQPQSEIAGVKAKKPIPQHQKPATSNAAKTARDPNAGYTIHQDHTHVKVAAAATDKVIFEFDLAAGEEALAADTDYKWCVYRSVNGKVGLVNRRGEAVIRPGFDAIALSHLSIKCTLGQELYRVNIEYTDPNPDQHIDADALTAYWIDHKCPKCNGTRHFIEDEEVTRTKTTMRSGTELRTEREYNDQTKTWGTKTYSHSTSTPETHEVTETKHHRKQCDACDYTGLQKLSLVWRNYAYTIE